VRDATGKFRASENAAAAGSPQKKKRLRSRKPTKSKSKKGAAARAFRSLRPPSPAQQQGIAHPRLTMSEALRLMGVNEIVLAEHYADTLSKLSGKAEDRDGVAKLFIDFLKECTRHLDSPRSSSSAPAGAAAANETRVFVNLIHEVARPNRPTPASIATEAATAAAPPDAASS
jgi:hypothetical protein